MNYVLSDECIRATEIVKDICNSASEYGIVYGMCKYSLTTPTHHIRDIIDIYAFTNRELIVAAPYEIFSAVYNAVEAHALIPKTDEYTALDITRHVLKDLHNKSNVRAFSAFTHHAKLGAVFNGSSTFGTLGD